MIQQRYKPDLEAFVQAAPHLMLVLDPALAVLAVNDALLRATHTTREDVVGRNLFEAFPDNPANGDSDGQSKLRASLERVLDTRRADKMPVQRYDVRRYPDGEFECRYWHPMNYPVLDDSGQVAYIIHQSEEVTELVALRERDTVGRHATEILESITDGFFAIDRGWRFTYINGQAQRVLRRNAEDLVGRVLWEVYPGLVGSDFERVYRRAMDHGAASSTTAYYADHDRWYEVHVYSAPDGISIYFRDVTDRKRAETERERLVAESETQRRIYEAALSNTPDLVYIFDLDHRFIYANEALLTMWGRTREEALGRNCLELGYEAWHAEMHDREIEQVVATRQAIRGEVPFTGTNGRRIYDYIFVPVFGADDAVVAVAGTTRDVTERQHAEQEIREQAARLREADRAKDEFLATLSHELRNPLAPISNCIEILKLGAHRPELAARARETLERQLKHLVRLVDDLLDVSRITRGRLELRKSRVELASIVEQALEASRPLIEARRHALTVTLPQGSVGLEGDAVRLVQVISNLLNNAAKYTAPGGALALEATAVDRDIEISVTDTGIGIAPDMLGRVFDMFSRADQSLERSQDGLGIGLTLARRLVELHGGTIRATSPGLGLGSEFIVRLPALQTPASAQPHPASSSAASP